MPSRRRAMSNQHWKNVICVNVEIYNVYLFQRRNSQHEYGQMQKDKKIKPELRAIRYFLRFKWKSFKIAEFKVSATISKSGSRYPAF